MIRNYWCCLSLTIMGCARPHTERALAVPPEPLVVVCSTPGMQLPAGPPGSTAWATGRLMIQMVVDTAARIAVAPDTATSIEGSIDLAKRTHSLNTAPLLGHREASVAWTWATNDSIHIKIGVGGDHTSLWLGGARITADSAVGRWWDGLFYQTTGTFVLTGMGSAAPGRLIPACS